MDVFGKKYKLRMLAESASSFHQSFKYSQWWCFVFKKKFFFYIVLYSWELHISFKMDTEKVLYQKIIGKSYIVKLYCQIQYIIFCAPNHPFEGYKFRIIVQENIFAAILHLKGIKWKFMFSWRLLSWPVLEIAKVHYI